MALDPVELAVIGVIVLVIFLWGPSKIPEMARSLGRARKEFESAQKDIQDITKQFQAQSGISGLTTASGGSILDRISALTAESPSAPETSAPPPAQPAVQPAPTPALPSAIGDTRSADQVLIDTARQLGISTEGKTRDEVAQEILLKAKAAGSGSSSPAPT